MVGDANGDGGSSFRWHQLSSRRGEIQRRASSSLRPQTLGPRTPGPRTRRAVTSQTVVCALLPLTTALGPSRTRADGPRTVRCPARSAFCVLHSECALSREGRFRYAYPSSANPSGMARRWPPPLRRLHPGLPMPLSRRGCIGVLPSPLSPASPGLRICLASWWNHIAAAHGMLHK